MENSEESDINDNDEPTMRQITIEEAASVIRELARQEGLEGAEQIILIDHKQIRFGPRVQAVLLEAYDSLLRKEI